jgi:hypothetical protein
LFDSARVMQRFGLRGNAKSLLPLIFDVVGGHVMWVDASLSTTGYGHSVGRYGLRLGRVAADLWEHFAAGTRATLLDVAAWHAAARADSIVVVRADDSAVTIPVGAPAATVAAIRAAAATAEARRTPIASPVDGRTVFAATVDPQRLATIAGAEPAAGSVAVLVDGHAGNPWTQATAADLMAALTPDRHGLPGSPPT